MFALRWENGIKIWEGRFGSTCGVCKRRISSHSYILLVDILRVAHFFSITSINTRILSNIQAIAVYSYITAVKIFEP